MFSWVVNYPFASQLSYRIRIAPVKEGQNNENAINRNNPVYQDNQVMSTSMIYPTTAKPLEKFQPYAWTVDAYYKGILLGGAEAWRFTIIDDSLLVAVPVVQSYYEFENHLGETKIYAVGSLKLKYVSDNMVDTLGVQLLDMKGQEVRIKQTKLPVQQGVNKIDIPFYEQVSLQHNKEYVYRITTKDAKQYNIPFVYINPLYIK